MKDVLIHLPRHQYERPASERTGFYHHLATGLAERGHQVAFACRQSIEAHPSFHAEAFHFCHQGLVRQGNVLNTGIAYLKGFWYADPMGVFADSSIAGLAFDPEAVDGKWAAGFARRLRARLIGARASKYAQPKARHSFAPGAIAAFLQGPSEIVTRARHMSEPQMIRALARARPATPVLVKPHPQKPDPDTLAEILALQPEHPNIRIVDANIHDMLAGALVCASICSSVAIEAMLHNTPALMFGRTDFHHCATTVTTEGAVAAALDEATRQPWPYDRFLLWFLKLNCLDLRSGDWLERIAQRMQA